ncbi:unnamed protein product [Closterium sp. Yama58-4]|nr:unnamed protein product [Closterium sp. Yama58-4]
MLLLLFPAVLPHPLPPPTPFQLRPAIVAAQALRFSRTPHDLLLLLSSSVPRQPSTLPLPLLLRHFTAVIPLPANHLQGATVAANPLLVAGPGGAGAAGGRGSGGGTGWAAGDGLEGNQGTGMAGGGSPVEGYRKLHVWRLVEYDWVLYLDVDVLITRNLDHLFPSNAEDGSSTISSNSSGSSGSSSSSSRSRSSKGAGKVDSSPDTTSPHRQPCPEPLAAAPDVYEADRFNAGVLLVRPSLAVFRQIVRRAKVVAAAVAARAGAMPNDQDFLNSVFRHWFKSHPSCRLSFTTNAILHFPLPWYQPPSWLHPPCGPDCAPLHLGPVHTVHFANPWFKPWLFLNTPLDQLIPGSHELGFKGAVNSSTVGGVGLGKAGTVEVAFEAPQMSRLSLSKSVSVNSSTVGGVGLGKARAVEQGKEGVGEVGKQGAEGLEESVAVRLGKEGAVTVGKKQGGNRSTAALSSVPPSIPPSSPSPIPPPLSSSPSPPLDTTSTPTSLLPLSSTPPLSPTPTSTPPTPHTPSPSPLLASPVCSWAGVAQLPWASRSDVDKDKCRRTLLLVSSRVAKEKWAPYDFESLFWSVRVVDPVSVRRPPAHAARPLLPDFLILRLWQQVDIPLMAYVQPLSLFWRSCIQLFSHHRPFAAAPLSLPPDRFSTSTLLLAPSEHLFQAFISRLSSPLFPTESVNHFLNAAYSSWYTSPPAHRLPLSFATPLALKPYTLPFLAPFHIITFDGAVPPYGNMVGWRGQPRFRVVLVWRKIFCGLPVELRTSKLRKLCR